MKIRNNRRRKNYNNDHEDGLSTSKLRGEGMNEVSHYYYRN